MNNKTWIQGGLVVGNTKECYKYVYEYILRLRPIDNKRSSRRTFIYVNARINLNLVIKISDELDLINNYFAALI